MSIRPHALARVSIAALLAGLTPALAHAQTTAPGTAPNPCLDPAHSSELDCRSQKPETDPSSSAQTGQGNATVPAAPGRVGADGVAASEADGTVTVTGSRIRLPNLENLQPTLTTDRAYLVDRGITNVADALNELPGVRGSITPAGAQGSFGQGVNFINIGGLGSNRTLTLVNGRRFVSSNVNTLFNQGSAGTQVDLNVINSLLLDRVDQVFVGGAPTYGSDAIAGTVNIILRDRFKGLETYVTSGVTERGDGFHFSGSALAGHDFLDGRLNITAAYQHDEQDGVLSNDRSFFRNNLGGATNPSSAQALALGRTAASGITPLNDGRVNTNFGYNNTATDGNPGTVQVRDLSIYYLTRGGVLTAAAGGAGAANAAYNYQFDASGNLVPFNKGIPFVGINASGGDGFRFNDYTQITSQTSRDIANAFVHYDVSDALKFFYEGEYFHSRGDELVQQPTFNSNLFSGSSGPLTLSNTSPFLTAQARSQLAALGITRFQVSRASDDLADLTGYSTTNLYRAAGGARGDFKLGKRDFYYEVSGVYGRTDLNDTSQDVNAQNFINAVNVTTNAAGQIVCNSAVTAANSAVAGFAPRADAACVPLNLLGSGLGSAAARNYVIAENVTKSVLQQYDFIASLGGSPFDIFGNKVGFSAGYEHREEIGRFTPSAFQQQGLGRSVAIAPVSGNYNVDEVFGETILPLVSPDNDLRFLNRLEVQASGRYVDNTVNGGFFAWSAGGKIAMVKDLVFRGNFTKSFRAPAITELFLPISNSFSTVPDLCSPANRNAGSAPAARAANCAAFIAAFPNATPLDAASATVPSRSGGNPTLQNEVANTWTFGAILQPRWIPGFSVTADWIHIDIANPITNLSVATIASACFDNTSFNTADPANGNAFCSQLRRYTAADGGTAANGGSRAGQVVNDPANPGVVSGFVNGKRILYSSIQGGINYVTGLERFHIPGRFETTSTIYFLRRRLVDTTGVAPLRTDGTFGDPKFTFQTNVRYVGERFGASGSLNFVGKQIATRAALSPDLREFNTIDSYVTFNGSLFVKVDKRFRMTLSATNLFDRIGQEYYGVYPAALINDSLGRRFTLGVSANF